LLLPTTAVPKLRLAFTADTVPLWLEEPANSPWQAGIANTTTSRKKRPAKRSQRELRSIVSPFPGRTRVRTAGEFGICARRFFTFKDRSMIAERLHRHNETKNSRTTRCQKFRVMHDERSHAHQTRKSVVIRNTKRCAITRSRAVVRLHGKISACDCENCSGEMGSRDRSK